MSSWTDAQDDCLIAISGKIKPNPVTLKKLPPWRAVLIARVAEQAGLYSSDEIAEIVKEATRVGGLGQLVLAPKD